MIITLGITLFLQFLMDLQIEGSYVNNTYSGDLDSWSETTNYKLFLRLLYIIILIGALPLFLAFELTEKRTKYTFTITNIVFLTVILLVDLDSAIFIGPRIIIPFIFLPFPLFLYLYAKKSSPKLKIISSFFLFGFSLQLIGVALRNRGLKGINIFPIIIAPIFIILGVLVIISSTYINPINFARTIKYWVLVPVLLLPWILFMIAIMNNLSADYLISAFIVSTLSSILVILLLKDYIKSSVHSGQQDILGIFVKPQKTTEEEVSISKEKKICLVCKGKVARSNIYLCPECDTFYCKKCSTALSDLENMCWACDTPFDTSKPSKPFQKEEKEEIKVDKNMKGKGV